MTTSISIVESKRKKRNQRSERANMLEGHFVYVIGSGRKGTMFKLGRTSNMTARMASYGSYLGSEVMCLIQIKLPTRAASVELENHILRVLPKGLVMRGKEWFCMHYNDLLEFVQKAVGVSGVQPLAFYGSPAVYVDVAPGVSADCCSEFAAQNGLSARKLSGIRGV